MLQKLAYRQLVAFHNLLSYLKAPLKSGFSWKKPFAILLAIAELLGCIVFDLPVSPRGQRLNLDGYSLVFEDNFDGDELNMDAWFYRGDYPENAGFNSPEQISIEDGKLVITGEYRKDGKYGEGWYAGEVALRQKYCRGYFEAKCLCSDSKDYWSAFWIQADHPYDHVLSDGGIKGAELDIFEAMSRDEFLPWARNSVSTTIHCNGVDDNPGKIDSRLLGVFNVGNNIYKNYNTYGLEWTEDEYIFYINGVETARSTFGKGVSQVPETVILSLCMPGEINQPQDYKVQFKVDSIRIYQK